MKEIKKYDDIIILEEQVEYMKNDINKLHNKIYLLEKKVDDNLNNFVKINKKSLSADKDCDTCKHKIDLYNSQSNIYYTLGKCNYCDETTLSNWESKNGF